MKLFFNYSIDCELPTNTDYTGPERRPFFGGPESWTFAEESVRGFVARMDALGVRDGASLFVYPDVAQHQKTLYREMAEAGVEVALHLNGLRYSRLRGDQARWLGEMTYAEQKEALRMGKADLEDAIGQSVTGYRACYGSANNDTQRICDELGFTWASNASRRNRPEFFSVWKGNDPYPHFASTENNLDAGNLALLEIPITCGVETCYENNVNSPLDLRVETPPAILGEERKLLRKVIEENLMDMASRSVPTRVIIGGSHNTSAYGDSSTSQSQTLGWVVQYTRELATEYGLEFTPASFSDIQSEHQECNG